MNISRRIALLITSLLLLAQFAGADKTAVLSRADLLKRLQEGKPFYTEAQAQIYVRELIPLVEKAAGRKFKTIPPIKLINRAELAPVLTRAMIRQLKLIYPKWTADQVDYQAWSTSRAFSMCCLGEYDVDTRKLYLLPRNIKPLMDLTEVDPKYRQQIVKIVIAHELSHALQDQYVSIAKLQKSATTEEKSLALMASIEGFAVFAQDRVADQLKTGDAAKELARLIALGSIKGLDPAAQAQANAVGGLMQGIYIKGRDFIAWQFAHGGFDQVYRVLAAPPTKTSQIYHPETYAVAAAPPADYSQALKGLERPLGLHGWTVTAHSS